VHAWRPLELGPATLATRMSTALRYDQLRAGIDDFEDRNDAKHRWVASGWLQQDVRLLDGFVRLLPALGYEAADTSAGTTRVAGFSTPVEQDPRDEDVWLPRLGLIIQPRPGLRLKANALRSYRRPNFIELFHPDYTFTRGNPELRAEDAWNYDAGIELGIDRLGPLRDLRLEAAWFLREIDESIEWVRTASSGATVMPRNTGPARVRGSELSAALRLGARLELSASYTFVDSEIRATGRPLPHVPRNRLFARARLDLEAAWIWVEQIYEDKQSITPTGRNLADETWQLDAGLTLWPARFPGLHRLPERLSLSLEGTNLTEVQRFDGFGVPLPAQRLWMTRIRWSIGE
jgi:outer membrane receptor protein involved in Fe transport